MRTCDYCEQPVGQTILGRPRRFCSAKCRAAYSRHRKPLSARRREAALGQVDNAERKAERVLNDPLLFGRLDALVKANKRVLSAVVRDVYDDGADVGNRLGTGIGAIATTALATLVYDFDDNRRIEPKMIVGRIRDMVHDAKRRTGDFARKQGPTSTTGGDIRIGDFRMPAPAPNIGEVLQRRLFPTDFSQIEERAEAADGEEEAGVDRQEAAWTAASLGVHPGLLEWLDPAGQDAAGLAERRRRMDALPFFERVAYVAWAASAQSPRTMAQLSGLLRDLGWQGVLDEHTTPE